MSERSPEPPDPADQPHHTGPEGVFRANLEAFGERAARLCRLTRCGRLAPDSCFLALAQLWIQLARSHRRLADRPEPHADIRNDAEPPSIEDQRTL